MLKYLFLQQYLTIQFLTLLIIFILVSISLLLCKYKFNYYWKLIFINIIFMSFIVYLGGFFLAYIFPKHLYVSFDNKTYFIEKYTWRCIDIIFHQIPHLLIIIFTIWAIKNNYWNISKWNFSLNNFFISLIWIFIYFISLNPFNLYFTVKN